MAYELDALPAPIDGMNQVDDPEHVGDSEALWIQDGICDQTGRVRRRGPWSQAGQTAFDLRIVDTKAATGKDGKEYVATLGGTTVASTELKIHVDEADFASANTLAVGLGTHASSHFYGTIAPDNKGNLIIGATQSVDSLTGDANSWFTSNWVYSGWNASTTSVTYSGMTVTQGSTTVTGVGSSFLTELAPGAILMDAATNYLGTVKEVESDTVLYLETGALTTATAIGAYVARAWIVQHGKGLITVADSGTAVTGVNTKFLNFGRLDKGSNGIQANDWALYRRRDGAFIGDVSSVADDVALTLATGTSTAMVNEPFIAIPEPHGQATNQANMAREDHLSPGFISVNYAGRQWYMNSSATEHRLRINEDIDQTNRVIFSAPDNAEDIDWAPDGDWFDLPSIGGATSPIIGAAATDRALLCFKRRETIAITGRTPSEFTPAVVLDDGILHPQAQAPYGDGAIWAGRENVWWYNGGRITSLLDGSLGQMYKEMVKNSIVGNAEDEEDKHALLNVARDHAFLYLPNINLTRGLTKVSSTTTPGQLTLVINLKTGAVTTWSNSPIRAVFELNQATGRKAYAYMDKNLQANATASVEAYPIEDVFESTGAADEDGLEDMTAGPDFYIEYKRWSANSEFMFKKLKRIRVQYLSAGGTLVPETIVGKDRGDINGVATATLAASTTFTHDDILLTPIRDEWIGFRIYEGASVTDASVGEIMLLYKQQRATRT